MNYTIVLVITNPIHYVFALSTILKGIADHLTFQAIEHKGILDRNGLIAFNATAASVKRPK